MKRISAESKAELELQRLQRLSIKERVRQAEIILRAERPFTLMREKLQPFYVRSKARLIRMELKEERRQGK